MIIGVVADSMSMILYPMQNFRMLPYVFSDAKEASLRFVPF